MKPFKMATPQKKAQCVSQFIETNQIVRFSEITDLDPLIRTQHKKFMEKGTVLDKGRSGRPRTFNENIDHVKQSFSRSRTRKYDCKLTKCIYYRHWSQKINQDEKSLQFTCWNEFMRIKFSSDEFILVTRQPSMFQRN